MESLSPWSLLNNGTLLIEEPLARIGNLIIYQGMIISGQSEKPKVLIHELFPNNMLSRVRATPKLRLVSTEKAVDFEREKESFKNGFEDLKRSLGQNSHGLYTADLFSENGTVYAVVGYKSDQVIVDDLYWDAVKEEFRQRSSSKTQSISDLWKNAMKAAEKQISPARPPEKSLEIDNKTNSGKRHEEQTREKVTPSTADKGRNRKPATSPESIQKSKPSNKNAKDDGVQATETVSVVGLKNDQNRLTGNSEDGQNKDKTSQDWDVLLGLGASANQGEGKNHDNSNQDENNSEGHRASDKLIIDEDLHGRTWGKDGGRGINLTHGRAQKIIIALFVLIIIQAVIVLLGLVGQTITSASNSSESNYGYCINLEEENTLSMVQLIGGTTPWS